MCLYLILGLWQAPELSACTSHVPRKPFTNIIFCCCRDEESDKIGFRGWARMAVPIDEFTIIEVRKPNVGENKPADVTADIVIDTSSRHCP